MKATKTKYSVRTGKVSVTTCNKLLAEKLARSTGKSVITLKDYRGK